MDSIRSFNSFNRFNLFNAFLPLTRQNRRQYFYHFRQQSPVAIQQGETAGENIWRSLNGEPRRAFHYFDRGSMATIGRAAAVADIRGIHLSGFLAWLSWLFVHLLFLIGFENRLLVLTQWAASYLSYQRGARLITGPWQAGTPAPELTAAAPPSEHGQTVGR